ncbi:hypothetical protein [Novosphingobium sp. FKTRR1]|uniref:hypothetical protein n=1 Tax=Novosphingobium sp. FKTRR1 TaxID=2879118 RepID=UPI001CEFFDC8|nr:hypothetical protein [Novosphingobium sp. FKTRR1]
MTTIGRYTAYQDRATYAQHLSETRSRGGSDPASAEESARQLDEQDRQTLRNQESEVGWARGEGVIVGIGGGNVSVKLFMHDTAHPEVFEHAISRLPDGTPQEFNAMNADFVVQSHDQLYGHDLRGIASYADYDPKVIEEAKRLIAMATKSGEPAKPLAIALQQEPTEWVHADAGDLKARIVAALAVETNAGHAVGFTAQDVARNLNLMIGNGLEQPERSNPQAPASAAA